MGKKCGVVQKFGTSFLSHFGGRSLSSQLDASAIMSAVMFKENFERIALSLSRFKLLRQSYFLWLRRLNLIASPNRIDLNVVCGR